MRVTNWKVCIWAHIVQLPVGLGLTNVVVRVGNKLVEIRKDRIKK